MRRLLAVLAAAGLITLATGTPASAFPSVKPATPSPTPSCKEWQTVTHVPLRPGASPRPGVTPTGSVTPTGPTRAVCRNAPPAPFAHETWDPGTVVGGAALGADGVVADLPPGTPPPPQVPDVAYVIADLDSGEVLAAKSPHAWLRPASTLKTLTALMLIPRVSPNYPVLATDEHVAANGTRVGMIAGNTYAAHYLFDAMLMLSANDAVYALTEAVGGYDRAVQLANAEAHRIGAFDTVVVDPSGLDEPGQHSSAYDLALVGRAAMQLPAFRERVLKRDAIFPGARMRPASSTSPSTSTTSTTCSRTTPAPSGSSRGGPTEPSTRSSAPRRARAAPSSSPSSAAPRATGRTPPPCSTGASRTPTW